MTGSFLDKNKIQKHVFTLDKTRFFGVVKIPIQFMKFIYITLNFGVWRAVNAHKFIDCVCGQAGWPDHKHSTTITTI
jgi:hypothetical protein